MNKALVKIICSEYDRFTKRKEDFNVIKYSFNYKSDPKDRILLDKVIEKGLILADKVNPGAANNSMSIRDVNTIKINSIAGILAEFLWLKFIKSNGIDCTFTEFDSSKNQIDLKLVQSNKKIEVRSSFPFNGLKFALCNSRKEFDVLGPYANEYKPSEIQKDFYVRTLFPFKSKEFENRLKSDNFEVFLTGGATWEMISDENIAIEKDLIPDDEVSLSRLESKSTYLVVPFSKALDSLQMIEKFK